LSEKRSCECETEYNKNLHQAENSRRIGGHATVCPGRHASRVLVSASRRNSLFSEVRDCETQSPTRETRALPEVLRAARRTDNSRSIYARNVSRAISMRNVSTRPNCSCARFSSSLKSVPCNAGKFGAITASERQRSCLPVTPSANPSSA
jgi:hypothetical protein